MKTTKKHRKLRITLLSIAAVLVIMLIGCFVYVNDYYHADEQAVTAMQSQDGVNVYQLDKNTYVFEPDNKTDNSDKNIVNDNTGLIFYPGGKVDFRAYAPLMQACAKEGIVCVLVKMPFNLAVFDVNAANGIQEKLPQIKNWYLGGHSLGGSMAANYIAKHTDQYQGLVLLGSYSVDDLSQSGLTVLSIYGSEDHVLNREKYQKNLGKLPQTLNEQIISGGCHAYYGMYGAQKGDGTPAISNQEQIEKTAELIGNFTGAKSN